MKVALIGSGLASVGVLSALKKNNIEVDQFLSQQSKENLVKHRLYSDGGKIILHKSDSTLKELRQNLEKNNIVTINRGKKISGLISSNSIGGLSNFWGGSSRKLLESESAEFVNSGLDLQDAYDEVTNFIGNKKIQNKFLTTKEEKEIFTRWVTTNNLNNVDSDSIFSSKTFIEKLNINKIPRSVVNISTHKYGVKVTHKDNRTIEDSMYDYVLVAAGPISSIVLASKLTEKDLSTALLLNEQRFFIAKYNFNSSIIEFNKNNNGPPSIIIQIDGSSYYIQLYPLESLYPLKFLNANRIKRRGILAGYIYNQFNNSNTISIDLEGTAVNFKINQLHKILRNEVKIKKSLNDEGIRILGPIVNFSSGSSQHLSSGLTKQFNPLNKMDSLTSDFTFEGHDRVIFVDSSIMPFTPLCTIGLTAMACANVVTKKWLNNIGLN